MDHLVGLALVHQLPPLNGKSVSKITMSHTISTLDIPRLDSLCCLLSCCCQEDSHLVDGGSDDTSAAEGPLATPWSQRQQR